jgi:hypothetical protein
MWHNPAQLTLAGSSTPGNDLAAMGRKVIVLQAPHLFLLGALPGISAQPRTGTRSEAIEKSAREPSMWCSRAGSKLLKFARAAIFRPDMINSGAVLPHARGTCGARGCLKKQKNDDPCFYFIF